MQIIISHSRRDSFIRLAALILGIVSWALASLCLFLALRFRIAPVPGDEEDIAVGVLIIFGWAIPLLAAVFGFAHTIPVKWKFVLATPCAVLAAALLICTIGLNGRP